MKSQTNKSSKAGGGLTVMHVSMLGIPLAESPGFRAQLLSEYKAAEELRYSTNIIWDTRLFVPETNREDLSKFPVPVTRIPRYFGARLSRRYFLWRQIRSFARHYDVVLVRHSVIDPFEPFHLLAFPNVAIVHHTKTEEELKDGGKLFASLVERFIQSLSRKWSRWPIGVTGELHRYARGKACRSEGDLILPNGIDVSTVTLSNNSINTGKGVSALFVASKFHPWHGLDKLLNACSEWTGATVHLHLVGALTTAQIEHVNRVQNKSVSIHVHGLLDRHEIDEIQRSVDVGIGSLALERNRMHDACTLKVREYLASGLPVYSGHHDAGLPEDFPYYKNVAEVEISELQEFVAGLRSVPREDIRAASEPFISKKMIMRRTADTTLSEIANLR